MPFYSYKIPSRVNLGIAITIGNKVIYLFVANVNKNLSYGEQIRINKISHTRDLKWWRIEMYGGG